MRFFLYLSYKGTAYNGWQIQKNAPSVQGTLQNCIGILTKEKTEITGAGRTDTGVHASHYVAHFDTAKELEPVSFCYHLNCILPKDIAVNKLEKVSDNAHSRFDAVSREYRYYISRKKNPFLSDTAMEYTAPLDIDAMNVGASVIKEYSDFTSFCKLHSDNKTNICTIYDSYWITEGDSLIYTVRADRFLRNMVRAIVGTLLDMGKGKEKADSLRKIIESKSRQVAGTSAPARGLFLTDITYNDKIKTKI
ncbi:MAG: tRNA pseudouridine(38-40) synthase TruA [Rikenellaceae bacterium]|nr:tRNA pseudouridine(38-40) synthase TruA [Rikenellaceae bacterium]